MSGLFSDSLLGSITRTSISINTNNLKSSTTYDYAWVDAGDAAEGNNIYTINESILTPDTVIYDNIVSGHNDPKTDEWVITTSKNPKALFDATSGKYKIDVTDFRGSDVYDFRDVNDQPNGETPVDVMILDYGSNGYLDFTLLGGYNNKFTVLKDFVADGSEGNDKVVLEGSPSDWSAAQSGSVRLDKESGHDKTYSVKTVKNEATGTEVTYSSDLEVLYTEADPEQSN